jgi:hypothetical protein
VSTEGVVFVDRERELAELRALADRGGPALALVYGRRRVGKTYLLDRAWAGRRVFYYLAANSTAAINRRELVDGLSAAFGLDLVPEDYPTWRSVFRQLVALADREPLVVVLDEFQYLMGQADDDVVSQLVAVWDREVGDRNLTLVLCGSEVGTMERLRAGDSPLYGRINWSARILPFDYRVAARMLPGRGAREWAYAYGVFGGTPRFLAAVREGDDLEARIREVVLSPRGEVHLQLATVIQQEQGIREPGDYQAVLRAVAEGRTETNAIATATGLQDRPYVVRRALEVLESLQLVRRERNFRAGGRAPWRTRIADPAIQFWYRFVQPNRSRLERGEVDGVWVAAVRPYLDQHMGWSVFEGMAADAFRRYHETWGWTGAREWARWEGQDRTRRGIELDIVAELDDGRILTGEVKWSSTPVDVDVHFDLKRDLRDLAHSGQGWAKDALDPERSAGHVYFSAAGFTDHFRERAEREGNVRLIDLERMYGP